MYGLDLIANTTPIRNAVVPCYLSMVYDSSSSSVVLKGLRNWHHQPSGCRLSSIW